MYTLHMSSTFRGLALIVALAMGLTSQATCLAFDQADTQSKPDCCTQMANNCDGTNTSMACCQTVVRTDPAVAATTTRNLTQRFDAAERAADVEAPLPIMVSAERAFQRNHEPPHDPGVSSLVLRI